MRIDMRQRPAGTGTARDVNEQLRIELERRRPKSLEEANQICQEMTRKVNTAPQTEFGGLTPEQVFNLTRPDWVDRTLRLNEKLSVADVSGSEHFHNVRQLLATADQWGAVKATATGAFSRQFATEMMKLFVIDEVMRRYNDRKTAVNQHDVPHLEMYRHLMPAAGLLLYRNREFRVTRKGRMLLLDDHAGELFAHMFRTVFVRMNLAAMDGLPENAHVQATVGYSICRLARMPEGWMDIEEIATDLILPAVAETLPRNSWFTDPVSSYARTRILRHLASFALVEFDKDDLLSTPEKVRKTPLFKEFISFSLPGMPE